MPSFFLCTVQNRGNCEYIIFGPHTILLWWWLLSDLMLYFYFKRSRSLTPSILCICFHWCNSQKLLKLYLVFFFPGSLDSPFLNVFSLKSIFFCHLIVKNDIVSFWKVNYKYCITKVNVCKLFYYCKVF